jgi:invasion protein IalB
MQFGKVSAPAGPARRALGAVSFGVLALLLADQASAQQTPAPAQQPRAQQPAQRPAAQPQPPRPAQQPAQRPAAPAEAQPAAPAPAVAETPPLIYSPWTKVCGKEGQPNAPEQKEVCFTIKEARLDTGQFVASAGVIEMEGQPQKILRVTLPLGLLIRHGTRMLVDAQTPMTGQYNFCLPNGCWADFEVNAEFVGRLKKAQNLTLQAFNLNGQVASFQFPLVDFAKANEGPATDPKVLEEQQKKLQEELQRRADEARKRLEQQGAPGAQPPKP